MTKFLFITDLDNTLVGDDASMAQLNQQLSQHREEHGTKIVYSTGRSLYSYRKLCDEKSLMPPDAVVTGVGTAIYYSTEVEPDTTWQDLLGQGWDRDRILAIATHFADLVPQPDTEQSLFKISYYVWEPAASEVLPRLKERLKQEGFQTNVIFSGGKDLDILPLRANKGLAMKFLCDRWQFEESRTVACGDSGNDRAFFDRGKERGIIVGNAMPELLAWHHQNPSPHRYLAQARYAAGVLEGLQHFEFL